MIKIAFLILLVSCSTSQKKTEEKGKGQEVIERENSFPGKLALTGKDIESYKDYCLEKNEKDPEELFKKAIGCLYSNESKKAYYIFKTMTLDLKENSTMKSSVLNNMGVMQARWGHLDLALTLFQESVDLSRNTLNVYNLLQAQLNARTLNTKSSLVPYIDNASESGPVLDFMRGRIAYLDGRLSSSFSYFDKAVRTNEEILNYLFLLKNSERSDEFEKVALKYHEQLKSHPDYLAMKEREGVIK